MKLKGKKIASRNFEFVVIPRPDGNIVFKAAAVLDTEGFEKIVKEPKPPMVTRPGGVATPDPEDEDFLKAIEVYGQQMNDWTILTSLSATEGLEWETVNMADPATYKNYRDELKASGFTQIEIGKIVRAVWIANSLDERKLEEARKSFLTSLQAEAKL